MGGFRKYILPGNEIKPGVWGAEEPEGFWKEGFDMRFDTIEICIHDDVIPGELSDQEDRCFRCGASYKNGRWV